MNYRKKLNPPLSRSVNNPVKGIFIADLQLRLQEKYGVSEKGVNSRLTDKLKILEGAVSRALENSHDMFIIGGDIFEKINPPDKLRKLFLDCIKPLFGKIPIFIIIGNHDTDNTNHPWTGEQYISNSNPDFQNVFVIDKPQAFNIHNTNFSLIPWPRNNEELIKTLLTINKQSIILGHFPIRGAKASTELKLWEGPNSAMLEPFIYTILGHYHIFQYTDQYVYVGSPARVDMSEKDYVKGYLEFTISNEEFSWFIIESNDRKFLNLSYTEPEIIKLPPDEEVDGAIVKLTLQGGDKWLNEQKALMISGILRNKGAHNVVKQIKRIIDPLETPLVSISKQGYGEMVTNYAVSLKREDVTEIGIEILNEANKIIIDL